MYRQKRFCKRMDFNKTMHEERCFKTFQSQEEFLIYLFCSCGIFSNCWRKVARNSG